MFQGRHRCTTNQQSYLILVSEILISIGFCSSGNTISRMHYFEGTKVSIPDKRGGFMTMTFGKRPQILVRLVPLNWLSALGEKVAF
ncbi:hypothetical protein L1987_57198 [Smallanthus sonchifolius]|uniref:Uncharacterized protein n=1 Tax=Smallanthus sonchifolius TaxID=185202 RepID=A0ACB9DC67_9ASTR|nr:hypothetical protein L1987_57198 [Smallanthus sonchifolius]